MVPDAALDAGDNAVEREIASLLYGAYTLVTVGLQREQTKVGVFIVTLYPMEKLSFLISGLFSLH